MDPVMDYLPNLRHLYAVTEIARRGSISAAADQVYLSQSAVTQGLLKLEQALGEPLFFRGTAGASPTPAGRVFLDRAERALGWLKIMEREISGRRRAEQQPLHRLLTTTQLRALIAIVDTGGFTRAALQLGLSQPTVQRAARELETVCQQQFFRRRPQGIEATWEARNMARHANLAFAEIHQGCQELLEMRGTMRGTLTVGSLPLAMTRLVPGAVNRLLEEFPETRVRIVDGPYEEQLQALLQGQLDVIVGALRNPAPSAEIVQESLFEDPLSIVVRPGHQLLSQPAVSALELSELDWIAPRRNTPAREVFASFFIHEGLAPPEHVIECSSLVATRGLLLESDRAALLPARQVELELAAGQLAVMPRPLAGSSRAIGLALRRGWRPTSVQTRFLQLLREHRVAASPRH
jgi:DNA-binding transcriptional LysR family regulator